MKKLFPLFLAGSLFCSAANAADLLSVYREAVDHDASFASASAALEAGREKLPHGRSGLLPTIGLGASTVWNDTDVTRRVNGAVANSVNFNSNGWSVSLTQPLFRWQNWIAYSQAEIAVAVAETQYAGARMDLIVRVAQAYFDVLLAQDVLTTADAQKKQIAEQLESAKRNFEVGTSTITDTHEAQARYDLVVAQEIAATNDLAAKRQAFQVLIGKEPDGLKRLKAGVDLSPPQPADINKWVEMAESSAIPVLLAQASHDIAQKEVERQRGAHYPTLDVVATHGRSSQSFSSSLGAGADNNSMTLGLQLAVPLYAGGALSSKDREVAALKIKARADLDVARRTAALNTRQAYLGVTSGLAQVKAFEAALVSSQSAVDSTKLGYEVGVRINLDVLNAQTQLFDTRQKLAKARLDTLTALLKLKAASGSLVEDDLLAVNALLE